MNNRLASILEALNAIHFLLCSESSKWVFDILKLTVCWCNLIPVRQTEDVLCATLTAEVELPKSWLQLWADVTAPHKDPEDVNEIKENPRHAVACRKHHKQIVPPLQI